MSIIGRMLMQRDENHRNEELASRHGQRPSSAGPVLVAFCTALLLGLALPASAKTESVPDWVREAAAQTLPHYPAETKAVVLLDDITYTVAQDGRAIEHHRRVVKILRLCPITTAMSAMVALLVRCESCFASQLK